MGLYDFSKKHYLISAAIGDQTTRFSKISKQYPKKTFLRDYFQHMRRSIHHFADQLYGSDDEIAGRLISLDEERSKRFVKMTALYFTVAMTARKENEKFLRKMNLSRNAVFKELCREMAFDAEEEKIGRHLIRQSDLDLSTFTVNWASLFASRVFNLDEAALSAERTDALRQMIHSSFLLYMKSFS